MPDTLLNSLIAATRWDQITRGEESLIVQLNFEDRRRVHGLATNGRNYYIGLPEFADTPIAIYMRTYDGGIYEYWTLGSLMHRASGGPSLVSFRPETKHFEREFYHMGLLHRTDGPAMETGYFHDDYRAEENGIHPSDPDFQVFRFKSLTQHWSIRGSSRPARDGISFAHYNDYTATIRLSTGRPESVHAQAPSVSAEEMRIGWDHSIVPLMGLYPRRMECFSYNEYQTDEYFGRTMRSPSFYWSDGYRRYDSNAQCADFTMSAFDQQLNLRDGPFWSDQDEFIALSEFDKFLNEPA